MADDRARVYDNARAIRNRARTRALERLRKLHPVEYRILLNEELKKAAKELADLEAEAERIKAPRSATIAHGRTRQARPQQATPPTELVPEPQAAAVLLKHGPRGDQTAEERIRTDVGRCPACINRHDNDHICPVCKSRPQLAGPSRGVATKRPVKWTAALERDQAAASR